MKKILKGMIYLFSWITFVYFVIFLFQDSEANLAYGLISGWWSALYMSRILKLKLRDIFIISLLGCIGELLFLITIFHDFSLKTIDVIDFFLGVIIFLSPFIIHLLILFFEQKIIKRLKRS